MKNRNPSLFSLLPCAFLLACTTAQAEQGASSPAATQLSTCNSTYQIVGALSGGVETESIGGVVFTDQSPFVCTLASAAQYVTFNFNTSATDSSTGCTYQLARATKAGATDVGSSEVLSCASLELHYGVTATPLTSDSDCNGLSRIIVDPKIKLNDDNCG